MRASKQRNNTSHDLRNPFPRRFYERFAAGSAHNMNEKVCQKEIRDRLLRKLAADR
jgi:hypothetical protein